MGSCLGTLKKLVLSIIKGSREETRAIAQVIAKQRIERFILRCVALPGVVFFGADRDTQTTSKNTRDNSYASSYP